MSSAPQRIMMISTHGYVSGQPEFGRGEVACLLGCDGEETLVVRVWGRGCIVHTLNNT